MTAVTFKVTVHLELGEQASDVEQALQDTAEQWDPTATVTEESKIEINSSIPGDES